MSEAQDNRAVSIFSACLCLAYLFPFHTYPFGAFYNDLLTMLGILIGIMLISSKKNLPIQLPSIAILPLGLAGIIFIQIVSGILRSDSDSIFPIIYFLFAALAMVLGASIAAEEQGASRLCTKLAYAYLAAGLISVVIASFQFFAKESFFAPYMMLMTHKPHSAVRPFANTGQTNHLALLLCLSVASVWWLWQAGRLRVTAAICIILGLVWGLVLTQSRIGWLIMPMFTLLAFIWRAKPGYKIVSGWLILGFLVLYGVLVTVFPSIVAALFDLSVASPMERIGEKSSSERLALFREAWQMSLNHPWFGSGWGMFGEEQLKLDMHPGSSVFANHAHNLVLNFAAELGWPITAIVFGGLTYWFFAGYLRQKITPAMGFASMYFTAVLIHSLVEYPLWYAYVLLPLALLMGVVHREHYGARSVKISPAYSVLFFFSMTAGILFTASDYRHLVQGFQYWGFISMGFKLEGVTPDKPAFTAFPQFYEYFEFIQTEAVPDMPPEKIAFMEKVSLRFGEMPNTRHMALIYSWNHRPDEAVDKLLMIRRLHKYAYADVYKLWQKHAEKNPEIFLEILNRLPKPD